MPISVTDLESSHEGEDDTCTAKEKQLTRCQSPVQHAHQRHTSNPQTTVPSKEELYIIDTARPDYSSPKPPPPQDSINRT